MQWLRRSLATGCLALLTVASASPLNSQVALASFPDFTRSLLDRSAHLTVRGVTLEEGLNELQARSGVGIAFSPALLAREARVDCLCAASTVGEALSWMLQGRSFTFAEFGGQVTIEPVSALEGFRREATGRPALQLAQTPAFGTVRPAPRLGAVEPLPLRQEPVTGTVVSARTGQPLAGAQVMIEGTTRGVVTNSTGRFLLTNVEAATVTLRVVIIGYREHTETVATGSNIRIELEEIAIDLDAIVVTGTAGGSRTRALGTTLARVDMTEAMRVGQSGTIQELLSSNVPGLNVASGPGNVGTGAAIKIRGIGSVSLGSGPLIYVDGVRIDNNSNARIGSDQGNRTMRGGAVSRLNDLNPEEIQNVEVIKGPAAATLYGTEASAGVIQITTKRGRVGAPQWEVTVRQGVSYLSNAVDRWPAVYDKGTNQCPNCELLPSGVRKFEVLKSEQALGHGIPFNYGHDQTYGISSRGGTDLIRYYVSAQMDRDEGFVDWNHQNKYSARANHGADAQRAAQHCNEHGIRPLRVALQRRRALPRGVRVVDLLGHTRRGRGRAAAGLELDAAVGPGDGGGDRGDRSAHRERHDPAQPVPLARPPRDRWCGLRQHGLRPHGPQVPAGLRGLLRLDESGTCGDHRALGDTGEC